MPMKPLGLSNEQSQDWEVAKTGRLFVKRIFQSLTVGPAEKSRNGGMKMARGPVNYVEAKNPRFVFLTPDGDMLRKTEVIFPGKGQNVPNSQCPDDQDKSHRGSVMVFKDSYVKPENPTVSMNLRSTSEYDVNSDAGWNRIAALKAADVSETVAS